jgi:hypothetical protein
MAAALPTPPASFRLTATTAARLLRVVYLDTCNGRPVATIAAVPTRLTRIERDKVSLRDYNVLTAEALAYRATLVAAGALPPLSPALTAITA